MPILSVKDLTMKFGGLTAISNVNIEVEKGELVGLIGPNGAGKTTVFNMLTGMYEPTNGSIKLTKDGKEISLNGLAPYEICSEGVARTFQNIRLFKELSVIDNVKIAMHKNIKYGLFSGFFHLKAYRAEEKRIIEECIKLLKVLKLEHKKDEKAKNLSYGEQRNLEIVRALATNPSLLLLDEPAAGMNPAETAQLTDMISWIRNNFDLTILLIEHDMSLVMKICERIYVLDHGVVIANGTSDEIKTNEKVIEAYLGEDTSLC